MCALKHATPGEIKSAEGWRLLGELIETEGAAAQVEDVLIGGELSLDSRCQRIQPPFALPLHLQQSGIAEHAQVFGHVVR